MTDKKTENDDAAVPAPASAEDEARKPGAPEENASAETLDGAAPAQDETPQDDGDRDDVDREGVEDDDAPVRDPWDDPEDARAEDVLTRVDPIEIAPEDEHDAKDRHGDDAPEDAPEDAEALDEQHDEFDDHARPTLAGRALRALVIALVGGGAALWAAPKVAPMLPASVSRHLVVAVPVEESEFAAYRAEAESRIAGLESALQTRVQDLGAQIETAGKSGMTEAETDAAIAQALESVTARIASLDETLADGDLSGLAARLSTLETQMAGLTRQLDSLAGGLESVGEETGSVGEMSQAAVARLAANAAQIEGLRGQIDQLAKQTGAMAQRLEQAETEAMARAANAEADADKRAAEAAAAAAKAEADAEARAQMATVNAALDEIAASLDAGQPFSDALARIDAEAPEALAAMAEAGVPTNAALRAAFTPAAHEAIRADAVADAGDGVADKLLAGITSQFKGVPTVATDEGGVAGMLGEASGKLADDDVAGAIAAIDRLPEAAAGPMADWRAQAALRSDAKSALAGWRAALTKTDG